MVSTQNAGFTYISFYLLADLPILPLSPTVVFAVGNVVPVLISIFPYLFSSRFSCLRAHAVIRVASPFFFSLVLVLSWRKFCTIVQFLFGFGSARVFIKDTEDAFLKRNIFI